MPNYVPAIRGQMGDWTYYVTAMKLAEVARGVRFAEELHSSTELDELIQREIGDRVERDMVPYLLREPQHFYGAIIVAVYGGEPEFSKVKVAEHDLLDDNERSNYGFGLLRFDGSQQYFALDGQHRLKSIQLALKQNKELGKEDITVIMVSHQDSPEGLSRTRRLFSTLNRRAEKTKVGLNIAIDEDDPNAIVTRRLIREHAYLGVMGMVKANKEGLGSKQLSTSPKDAGYFTTLQTLYECNEYLLKAFNGGMDVDNTFRTERPDDATLETYYDYLSHLWTIIFDASPDLEPVRTGRQKPGSLRIDKRAGGGGSVAARPIGQLIIAEILMKALLAEEDPDDFLHRLFTEVPFDLDQIPWKKLVWNSDTRTIIGSKAARTMSVKLLLHKFGLLSGGTRQLLEDYRNVTQDKTMKLLPVSAGNTPSSPPEENNATPE